MYTGQRYYSSVHSNASQADLADSSRLPSPYFKPMLLSPSLHKDEDELQSARRQDEVLKTRIRKLRVIARLFSCVLSLAVFVPIAMTFRIFLATRDNFKDVSTASGVTRRTAWAKQTTAWPTYMYFFVSLLSLTFNAIILAAYFRSVKSANVVSTVSSVFNWLVIGANLVVWAVAVTLYRTERNKDGKNQDLWGWTCSDAARLIQHAFEEVNFDRYCNVQSASWYAGILQGVTVLLSAIIFYLAALRRRAKRTVRKSMTDRIYAGGY